MSEVFQYFEEVAGANAKERDAFQTERVWIEAEDKDYEADKVIKTVVELARDWLSKVPH
jgi:hypothetical protein